MFFLLLEISLMIGIGVSLIKFFSFGFLFKVKNYFFYNFLNFKVKCK